MKHHQTQHPQESLPIVIPLVLYTGKPKWTAPLDIFPYFSGLMEYVFKHAQARDMRKVLDTAFPWLYNMSKKDLPQAMLLGRNMVFYITRINKILDEVTLNESAQKHLDKPLGSTIMTLAEKWKEEGREEVRTLAEQFREEGRQEGKQQGEIALLKKQLTRRFGALNHSIQKQLEQATPDQLIQWGENILDAETLEEVFLEKSLNPGV